MLNNYALHLCNVDQDKLGDLASMYTHGHLMESVPFEIDLGVKTFPLKLYDKLVKLQMCFFILHLERIKTAKVVFNFLS